MPDHAPAGGDATLILGMHRSGTSLLGSLVQSLGVDLGDKLFPGDAHNPAGYFEDEECVAIHERMLGALGQMPWHGEAGMLPMPRAWWREAAMRPLVAQLERWIDRRVAGGRSWGLKDPRTTRFLPLWRELLQRRGVRARYLLAVRDPAEVAGSIAARDAAPAPRIQRTWLRFNMEALLHAGDALAGVFVYADWFDDGATALRRLAAALGVAADDARIEQVLGERLRADLHRQRGELLAAEPWARGAYGRLCAVARDPAARRRCAAELEYADALLRQGDEPDGAGELVAVLGGAQTADAARRLAATLRAHGARVALSLDAADDGGAVADGVARLERIDEGPELGGWPHARAAHLAWRWSQPRAYAQWHVVGGDALAVHLSDARRQGWDAPEFELHYLDAPRWLRDDALLEFSGVHDAEAACLEARALAGPARAVHGDAALLARLRLALQPLRPPAGAPPRRAAEPLVSVCVIHYNRPELLADCLRSVRAQSWRKLEVVLVDDGSTHAEALAYLDSLQAEFDSRGWRLIRQRNAYLGAARNAAARAARGDYLFFVDDDNLLHPDGVARAVQVAERTGADVVTALMNLFSAGAGTQPTWPTLQYPQAGHAPLLGVLENTLGDANALVRRSCWEALGGSTEDRGRGAEDWEFFARAVLAGHRLELCLLPCSWYRVDAASMSRAGDAWGDYRRAMRAYEAALPPTLRELPALAGALKQRVAELEPARHEAAHLRDAVAQLRAELAASQRDVEMVHGALAAVQKHAQGVEQALHAMYLSSSWRVTEPLRWSMRRARQLARVPEVARRVAGALAAERRRHGVVGVARRVPYYLQRRDTVLGLLRRSTPLASASFDAQPARPRKPARLHPDLAPQTIVPMDASVAVVIPTFNAGAEFGWLLRKLRAQRGLRELQVVVVDSGSTDGTADAARAAGCTVVEIAQSEFTHSGSRNLGAAHARADYLLFMVQDAYPVGDHWAYGMLRFLLDHADDGLVAVSCSEYPRSDSDMMYDSMVDTHYRFLGCRFEDRIGRLAGSDHMALRAQGQLSDVACLIGRDTFARYRYRGDYAEDLDLGMRIIRDGLAVAMLASVKVVHSHNRPAWYYLKRSFVDVVYLVGMFDDFTYPRAGSVAGLAAAMASTAVQLSAWLAEVDAGAAVEPPLALAARWRRDFELARDGACALGEPALDAWLASLAARAGRATAPGARADAQLFADIFLGRLEHFGRFAASVHPAGDDALGAADIVAAVRKTFAASVGSALGFAYMALRDGADAALLRRVHDELKAGV
jgi:glycosyltransferase involved in cell wall biosynthesis